MPLIRESSEKPRTQWRKVDGSSVCESLLCVGSLIELIIDRLSTSGENRLAALVDIDKVTSCINDLHGSILKD